MMRIAFPAWAALAALLVSAPLAQASFAGGSGSSVDPWQIENWYHLDNVRLDLSAHYILMNNLTADDLGYEGLGDDWEPIGHYAGQFTGVFDGNNKAIHNLTIDVGDTIFDVGFFHIIEANGIVKNLGLVNSYVNSVEGPGGIASGNLGLINNSYNIGVVSGGKWGLYVGGIVGQNYGTISNSYFSGSVDGYEYVGGLVGYSSGNIYNSYSIGNSSGTFATGGLVGESVGPISNSFSRGDVVRVSGSGTTLGGLVGSYHAATISNSYSTGSVSGDGWNPTDKGFVGYDDGGSYSNNFFDSQTSSQSSGIGATPKTTPEMKLSSTFSAWDFDTVWGIDEGNSYPYLNNPGIAYCSHPSPPDGYVCSSPLVTYSENAIISVVATYLNNIISALNIEVGAGGLLTYENSTLSVGSITVREGGRLVFLNS
jgi:hypothetical protein